MKRPGVSRPEIVVASPGMRGMVLAVPGVFAAGGLVRGLLVDVSPWAPLTLVTVAFGLLLVTVAACYLPARRVLKINPASLLRQD